MQTELTFGPHFDADLIGPNGEFSRLHKGGGGGGPSSAELARREREQKKRFRIAEEQRAKEREEANRQLESLLAAQAAQAEALANQAIEFPEAPPVKPEDPPVKSGSTSKSQAEKRAKKKAASLYGLSKTRIAGNTGGFQLGAGRSLLGGGGYSPQTNASANQAA